MATFGDDGRNIWPSAATLVGRANVHERTARRLRRECLAVKLFRETSITRSGIPVLEISIPRTMATMATIANAESLTLIIHADRLLAGDGCRAA